MGHDAVRVKLTETEARAILRVVDCPGAPITPTEARACDKIRAAMKRPAPKRTK